MNPLLIEAVTSEEALEALAPEWANLALQLSPRLPFQQPWWHFAWFRRFAENRAGIRDTLAVRTLRRTNGELAAVVPLMITERPATGPFRTRTLQFVGTDPNLTEVRGVICRGEDEADVFRTLLGALRRERRGWGLALWSGLRRGGDGERLVLAEPGVEPGREIPDYVLDLPDTWEALRARFSRNLKESLRKCANSPKRDGLAFTFHVVTEPAAMDAALDAFFALHRARAGASSNAVHADAFISSHSKEFLRYLAREGSPPGTFRVYQVRLNERVLATRVGMVIGDMMYLYYSGYDPEFAKYSVMTTCVAWALRHAIETGIKQVNLSTGNDVSKTRWGPSEIWFRDALWVSPSVRGRISREGYAIAEMARGQLKNPSPLVRFLSFGARHR
jgi:CelD/BcsL family acetyltransferase involved in cellulose biosynthesis